MIRTDTLHCGPDVNLFSEQHGLVMRALPSAPCAVAVPDDLADDRNTLFGAALTVFQSPLLRLRR